MNLYDNIKYFNENICIKNRMYFYNRGYGYYMNENRMRGIPREYINYSIPKQYCIKCIENSDLAKNNNILNDNYNVNTEIHNKKKPSSRSLKVLNQARDENGRFMKKSEKEVILDKFLEEHFSF